ncbi:MAG: toll/interleukin-1 receptor domain-containing protein [Dysgonamonadaceae bacterium]|jgi:hypothetical protein|nr:toll/interleukin-1 receptor domain-containing protein [Dysgonamonadaceae bacterium]
MKAEDKKERDKMRTKLFISHATPTDNEFAAWLATKLELYGYDVWVDIRELDPASDFWKKIETTIRDEAIKFLFVATKESTSGKRDGINKELAVADRVRKATIADFILPLRVDDVSFDDFPVEILRQNAIDFYNDWASGLIKLLEYLEKCSLPKMTNSPNNMEKALRRWRTTQTSNSISLNSEEDCYASNLFPVYLPKYLYVYNNVEIEQNMKKYHFPYRKIQNQILTLACPNCLSELCDTKIKAEEFSLSDIINNSKNITAFDVEIKRPGKICIDLINWNIDEFFFKNNLNRHPATRQKRTKNKFFFKTDTKSRRNPKSRLKFLSGKYGKKHWHYGLSAYYTQFPYEGILFRAHLIFTDSHNKVLSEPRQVKARRSKGRSFFNKEWRDMLQAAIYFFSNGSESIKIDLCCSRNQLIITSQPYTFTATTSYIEPTLDPTEIFEEVLDDDE